MKTRYAPAPTGFLHLGHVVNAMWVWGVAQAHGGRVLLRIEDHDRTRCRPEYEAALLDDLDWLGFRPDVGATDEFRAGPHPQRQSDNPARYHTALAQLTAAGRIYHCRCSRKDIAELVGDTANIETPYPGTCRHLGLGPGPGTVLRVVLDDTVEHFTDLRLGPQSQQPAAQCGDMVVQDRNRNWTYQFAVTVDDMAQEIDVVIRGEDLLSSTGRQVALARLLGRTTPPRFLHHPLLLKPSGQKLSKSSGDTGIRELRAAGHSPESVLGHLLTTSFRGGSQGDTEASGGERSSEIA